MCQALPSFNTPRSAAMRPGFMVTVVTVLVIVTVLGFLWLTGHLRQVKEPLIDVHFTLSPTPFNVTARYAHDHGFFLEEGLNVIFEPTLTGYAGLRGLSQPGVRVTAAAESAVGAAIADGVPIKVLASVASIIDLVVIAYRKDLGIHRFQELAGRRIGIASRTTSDYYLDVMLELKGMKRESVTIVSMPLDELGKALKNGTVDAISIWSPHYERIREEIPNTIGIFGNEGLYHWSWLLTVRDDDDDTLNRDTYTRLLRAMIRAGNAIQARPKVAADELAPWVETTPQILLGMWSWCSFDVQLGQSVLLQIENAARWYQVRNFPDAQGSPSIDVLSAIDPVPLRLADPIRVQLIHPAIP